MPDTSKCSFQIKDDRVLISQRSWDEEFMPGRWTIPGGKVDHADDDIFDVLQKTLEREVLEETGIHITKEMELVTNNSYTKENGQHVVAIVFKCHYKSGQTKPLENTIDCKWATIDEINAIDFPPNVKEYILAANNLSK